MPECRRRLNRTMPGRLELVISDIGLPPLHFPNPGRGSGGITPGKCLEFHMWFGAFWGSLVAVICRPSDPRYICNFAIKIEPNCQLQCAHDCTVLLLWLVFLYYASYYYCYYFHYFYLRYFDFTLKSGTFGVPGLVLPGRGTAWDKSGTSREIQNGWQPYSDKSYRHKLIKFFPTQIRRRPAAVNLSTDKRPNDGATVNSQNSL